MFIFNRKEKGQGLVEYALILVLIAIVVIVAMTTLGNKVSGTFDSVNSELGGNGAGAVVQATATPSGPQIFNNGTDPNFYYCAGKADDDIVSISADGSGHYTGTAPGDEPPGFTSVAQGTCAPYN